MFNESYSNLILQAVIEIIYIFVQSVVYCLILFSMIGFPWEAGKLFWFIYFMFMCFVYFTIYGMMCVALTPNHYIGAIVNSFFLNFWNLFSGFLIARPRLDSCLVLWQLIPIWWRWYYWLSPVAWTLYGLITSQVGGLVSPIAVPGQDSTTVKQFLNDSLGYKESLLGAVAGVHVAFVVLFLGISLLINFIRKMWNRIYFFSSHLKNNRALSFILARCTLEELLNCTLLSSFFTDDIHPWWIWGYWISPATYAQNAVALNEFLDKRWNTVSWGCICLVKRIS
ncbi:hypothetical protein EJ110_NYTH48921 [Nymphaea thermarum]|nr:hypothetical protein EJ110_NYTH48921 [Nymphaea thermarum]